MHVLCDLPAQHGCVGGEHGGHIDLPQPSYCSNSKYNPPQHVYCVTSLPSMVAWVVNTAAQYGLIRQFSTTPSYDFNLGYRVLKSNNTNALVRNGGWNINISKTGYINEAGRCVVMHTTLNNRPAVVVLLGAYTSAARTSDATRLMTWVTQLPKRI